MTDEEAGRAQVERATRPSDGENMAALLGVVGVSTANKLCGGMVHCGGVIKEAGLKPCQTGFGPRHGETRNADPRQSRVLCHSRAPELTSCSAHQAQRQRSDSQLSKVVSRWKCFICKKILFSMLASAIIRS